ncbi:MAG: hypothetical protein KY431_04810 [Actinobacteria bacterium]|nr:hypothetical protein [Actinomycetota bacterium]
MPWCDGCSRFWTVEAVPADRTCPSCGAGLPDAAATGVGGHEEKVPWHFKLLMAAVVVYLTWRAVQLVARVL